MSSWIFQANPDTFDIDGYLEANDLVMWTVRQEFLAPKMQIGDIVFLWRAAGKNKAESGIVASAQIIQLPEKREKDARSDKYWRGKLEGSVQLRVELHLQKRANKKEVIKKSWCQEDPLLNDLLILRMANQTNYELTEAQSTRLRSLWANTGRSWNRAEAIAGLWVYNRTFGQSLSKAEISLTAKVAVRIGRAVTGVYNKMMNYRHIDPRDTREGLSGAGEIDKRLWSEFYDVDSKNLKVKILEEEFERTWGSLDKCNDEDTEVSGEEIKLRSKENPPKDGQGRLADPIVRKAIEMRAVHIAKQYYSSDGFNVEDTGSFESFDLRCIKDGYELRVEVKGTTGGGRSIQLTTNEVEHAKANLTRVDLFIVSSIEVLSTPSGPQALGGITYRIENWIPADEHLQPATYTYKVPVSGLEH